MQKHCNEKEVQSIVVIDLGEQEGYSIISLLQVVMGREICGSFFWEKANVDRWEHCVKREKNFSSSSLSSSLFSSSSKMTIDKMGE
mmetsp:Transcript_40703/g.56590  ORF Transcript_40703/g.56590 Transcript_40703/m.56590 type:complete len:86 (+) Transcript_40703:412-669(+)